MTLPPHPTPRRDFSGVMAHCSLRHHPHWPPGCFSNAQDAFFLSIFALAVSPPWNAVAPEICITLDLILIRVQMSPSPGPSSDYPV